MPLYEYTCPRCRKKFELLRDLADRDEECECPHCKNRGKKERETSQVSASGHSGDGTGNRCGPSGSPFT